MIKLNKSNGFTLIELLVALAIAGTILLAFFKIIDSTNRMNAKNDRDIKALNIAQSEIENLRNQIKNHEQLRNIEIKYVEDIVVNIDNNSQNEITFVFNRENKNIIIDLNNISQIQKEVIYIKNIDNKDFKIFLDISKSEVKTQGNSINTGMYLYTINIKVKSLDEYFSKKETEIKDVKILSKNKS